MGWNLPPGCEVGDLPGNRPEDVAWDEVVSDLDDNDVLDECSCHHRDCDFAVFDKLVNELTDCGRGVVRVNDAGEVIIGEADPLRCRFVESLIEQRTRDRVNGDDGPEYDPEIDM